MNDATLPGAKRTALNLLFLAGNMLFAALGVAAATWAISQHVTGAPFEDRETSYGLYIVTMDARLTLVSIGGIAFLMWLYRSYRNAQMLGSTSSSPARITFSFFIPFAQLVIPYKGIQEMWRNSETRPNMAPKSSKLILAWWLFFLAWEAFFFIAIDEMPEALPSLGLWVAIVIAEVCGVIAAALGAWMVLSIRRRQKNQAQIQATSAYAIPATPLTYPT